jgi:hypothetical protein
MAQDSRKVDEMRIKTVSWALIFISLTAVLLNGCAKMQVSSSTSAGKAGSMARFTIADDYMYVVSDNSLYVFDLTIKNQPKRVQSLNIGWGIETIFCYKDLLFFGTRTGMLIYNIADPKEPMFVSEYRHINSCDPVVVEDGYAYVTLRTQTQCRRGSNELQIYDIKDPSSPILIKTYEMKNPWGLGIDRNKLFVCDGKYGLKVYDAQDPEHIKLLETVSDVNGYDVIPFDRILIVSARSGIFQFDYSSNRLEKLSRIPVGY